MAVSDKNHLIKACCRNPADDTIDVRLTTGGVIPGRLPPRMK